MRGVLCLAVLTVVVTCVRGWGRILSDNGMSYSRWIPARRSFGCGREREVCYQSTQCCRGYYCATTDPNDSKSSGFCRVWRQAQSESCLEDADCQSGYQCTVLGQVGSVSLGKCTEAKSDKPLGTMGDDCMVSTDCGKGLCCQIVRAFRRGPVRMCHRKLSYSPCINSAEEISGN